MKKEGYSFQTLPMYRQQVAGGGGVIAGRTLALFKYNF